MADLKKFTTTLTHSYISHHIKTVPFSRKRKLKRITAVFLAGAGTLTGTAKLVLDINIQKNDAR